AAAKRLYDFLQQPDAQRRVAQFLAQGPLLVALEVMGAGLLLVVILAVLFKVSQLAQRDAVDEKQVMHFRLNRRFRLHEVEQAKAEPPPEPQGPPFELELLPAADHFLGRIEELMWLRARLQEQGGGVAGLWGMPGVGKTALAVEAVRQMRDQGHFRDGIGV